MEFAWEILLFLFFAAAVAGFMDTLAGGGGLITIPALVVSGVPPLAALGTNKFQSSFGSGTSSFLLFKRKKIHWAEMRPMMIAAFIGSAIGTLIVQFIDTHVLGFVIPLVLIIIAVYFIAAPYLKLDSGQPRISNALYQKTVIPAIGVYDGMFGPGTGSFLALAGVSLRGLELIKATAMAKPLNFATNIASLIVFILADQVMWMAGFAMIVGQILGAWMGSHYLFRVNPKVLRLLIVTICFIMLGNYFYKTLL
ncbi:TSUP family transporter [Cellvibrio sp. pealriver]|uniref:TSUP family transporter n=1 Tax=Cellvibrio sp. pealriver TaxID=1622269 RepID=UPI00066FDA9C|nr:TSUP family transporter [Cellvibrio sp. pealriver]